MEAIEVARLTGRHLRIAAKVGTQPAEVDYYERVVRPAIAAADAEHLGELSSAERDQLYATSHATLMPGNWPEPFGLVAIESLACGTPVRGATRRGTARDHPGRDRRILRGRPAAAGVPRRRCGAPRSGGDPVVRPGAILRDPDGRRIPGRIPSGARRLGRIDRPHARRSHSHERRRQRHHHQRYRGDARPRPRTRRRRSATVSRHSRSRVPARPAAMPRPRTRPPSPSGRWRTAAAESGAAGGRRRAASGRGPHRRGRRRRLDRVGKNAPAVIDASRTGAGIAAREVQGASSENLMLGTVFSTGLALGLMLARAPRPLVLLALVPVFVDGRHAPGSACRRRSAPAPARRRHRAHEGRRRLTSRGRFGGYRELGLGSARASVRRARPPGARPRAAHASDEQQPSDPDGSVDTTRDDQRAAGRRPSCQMTSRGVDSCPGCAAGARGRRGARTDRRHQVGP